MSFQSYGSVADVAKKHGLRVQRSIFVEPLPLPVSSYFRSELQFSLMSVPFNGSEASASEVLIYPLLRETWKPYHETLTLWGHMPLEYDADLSGVPDYYLARVSRLGPFLPDQPYLMVVEAKKDDFERGWGQCLAAMVAAQKLNVVPGQTAYGVATNGRAWECGRLRGDLYEQDPGTWAVGNVDALLAALHYLVVQCRDQVNLLTPAA
jgi:hypothetical protein